MPITRPFGRPSSTTAGLITHDPYFISFDERRLYIDLAAERETIAAQQGETKIAVEVKTFGGPSALADLQQAVGQYVMYRSALRRTEPERVLYLAVDVDTEVTILHDRLAQVLLADEHIFVIIVDVAQERIVAWRTEPPPTARS